MRKETNIKILILGGTGAMGVLLKILGKCGESVNVTSCFKRISKFGNVKYDTIANFMVYSAVQFAIKKDIFLDSVKQTENNLFLHNLL